MEVAIIKKKWLLYLQLGAWIAGIAASFCTFPDLYEFDSNNFTNLTKFISCASVAIFAFPVTRYKTKKYLIRWWYLSIFTLLAAIFLTIFGKFQYDSLTVRYANTRTVIGDNQHLLNASKIQISKYKEHFQRDLTLEELVNKVAGNTDSLWDRDYLNFRRYSLFSLLILPYVLFTIFIISAAQAIKCK